MVTYEVKVLADASLDLVIFYCDPEGRAVAHTTARRWLKRVVLPAGQTASLYVTISHNCDFCKKDNFLADSRTLFLGKITSGGRMISEYSENLIMIALTQ